VKNSNRINRQRRLQKQLQILLLERDSRRCIICHHPEREAIEEEFVHWRAPWKPAASQLPSRQTDAQRAAELIYRSVIKKHGNP
jgi:hypothetical protein